MSTPNGGIQDWKLFSPRDVMWLGGWMVMGASIWFGNQADIRSLREQNMEMRERLDQLNATSARDDVQKQRYENIQIRLDDFAKLLDEIRKNIR